MKRIFILVLITSFAILIQTQVQAQKTGSTGSNYRTAIGAKIFLVMGQQGELTLNTFLIELQH